MRAQFAVLALAAMPAFSQRLAAHFGVKPQVESSVGIGNDIITHVADGGGWTTSVTLINLSETKAASFTLNFYGDDGKPLAFNFQGIGTTSTVSGTLTAGGSEVIKTTGSSAAIATQGWAQFDYFATTDSVGGFAVFTNSNGNEAAVPFETDLAGNSILSFDNTNGYGMGVALANSYFLTMNINATFKDANGNILGTTQFTMPSMTHTAFIFAQQWPFTAGKQGTVFFQCSDPYGNNASGLAILGLRYSPQSTFTSVTSFQQWTLD